jgi:hypothetical protein
LVHSTFPDFDRSHWDLVSTILLFYLLNQNAMTALVDTAVAHPPVLPQAQLLPIPATEVPAVVSNVNGFRQAAATATTNGVSEDPFKLDAKFAYTPRKMRVITIGAGLSGLLMAHKFQHRFPEMRDIVEHKIFDMRSDIGGTWLANHYPGVQCDVPAHIYVSSSEKPLPP